MFEDQSIQTDESYGLSAPNAEATPSDESPDHPHTGIPEEGWSAPEVPPTDCKFASLVVKRGGVETDIQFPICSPATVGRFDPAVGPIDVDLGSMPEGAYVSRKHAKIFQDDGIWKIKDLGSSNGTFVLRDDFEKITEAELADNSEIALGNARFVFHLTPGVGEPSSEIATG